MRTYFILLCLFGLAAARGPLPTPRRVIGKVISPYSLEVRWRMSGSRQKTKDRLKYDLRFHIVNDKTLLSCEKRPENVSASIDDLVAPTTIRTSRRKMYLNGLLPGSTYEIDVKVVRGKRSSKWSKPLRLTTLEADNATDTIQNLTVIPISHKSVMMKWQHSEVSADDTHWTYIATARPQFDWRGTPYRENKYYSPVTSCIVLFLKPDTAYVFQLLMTTNTKAISSTPVVARTWTARPTFPPRAVKVQIVQDKDAYIHMTWKPPNQRNRNGQLTGYVIKYEPRRPIRKRVQSVVTDARARSYQIPTTGHTVMRVRMAAQNVNGTGPFTKWKYLKIKQRKTDQEISDLADVSIKDDKVSKPDLLPLPPASVEVMNKSGTSLTLTWQDLYSPSCCPIVAFKIVVSKLDGSDRKDLLTATSPVKVIDLHPQTVYRVKVTSLGVKGNSKTSTEVEVKTGDFQVPKVTHISIPPTEVGGQVNLTCQAIGQEIPVIEWEIVRSDNSTSIQVRKEMLYRGIWDLSEGVHIYEEKDHDRGMMTSTLKMENVTASAAVEFRCHAKNSIGNYRKSGRLNVYEPPRITSVHDAITRAGDDVSLVCEAHGNPAPEIYWVHDDTQTFYVQRNSSHNSTESTPRVEVVTTNQTSFLRMSRLNIRNVTTKDAGHYVCFARSKLGQADAKINLRIKAPPIYKIQTTPLSPSSLSINWVPPSNYPHEITFYQVSYRKRDGGPTVYNKVNHVWTGLFDLDHGTEYLIGVIAGTEDGLGEVGPEVNVTTLTNDGLEPVNVSITAIEASVIRVTWNPPADTNPRHIHGFKTYYRREGGGRMEDFFISGGHTTEFVISGLKEDSVYYMQVSTLTSWGYEASSDWIKLEGFSDAFKPPHKLDNVKVKADFDGITVSWGKPEGRTKTEGFVVVYSPEHEPDYVERAEVTSGMLGIHLSNVKQQTEYIVSVRAYNQYGEGDPVHRHVKTPSFAPSAVTQARAQPVSSTEIHLQWAAPTRGHVTRYNIWYRRVNRKAKQSAWMIGSMRNYVAGSLKKNSRYRFEITPYNGDIPGEGSVIFASTFTDTPDGYPRNIVLMAANDTTLVATWQPPDVDFVNGRVRGYKVVLKTKGGPRVSAFRVSGSKNNFTFYDMDVLQHYQIRMAAITANGTGVFSPWVESSYASDGDKPEAPSNLVIKSGSTSIFLSWSRPKFNGSPVDGYIVGYGQFIPEVFRLVLDKTHLKHIITNLKPSSAYIVSVRAFNKIGESKPAFRKIRTRNYRPADAPVPSPVKINIRALSPTELVVTWLDPELEHAQTVSDGRMYLVRYSPMSGESYNYANTTDLYLRLNDLEPGTTYELSVKTILANTLSDWSLSVLNATKEIDQPTQPSVAAVSRETQPSVAAAPRETQPSVAAASRETQPSVAAAPRETQPSVAAAPREIQPSVAAAPRETQPSVAATPRETQPSVAAAPRETQPSVAVAPRETRQNHKATLPSTDASQTIATEERLVLPTSTREPNRGVIFENTKTAYDLNSNRGSEYISNQFSPQRGWIRPKIDVSSPDRYSIGVEGDLISPGKTPSRKGNKTTIQHFLERKHSIQGAGQKDTFHEKDMIKVASTTETNSNLIRPAMATINNRTSSVLGSLSRYVVGDKTSAAKSKSESASRKPDAYTSEIQDSFGGKIKNNNNKSTSILDWFESWTS